VLLLGARGRAGAPVTQVSLQELVKPLVHATPTIVTVEPVITSHKELSIPSGQAGGGPRSWRPRHGANLAPAARGGRGTRRGDPRKRGGRGTRRGDPRERIAWVRCGRTCPGTRGD